MEFIVQNHAVWFRITSSICVTKSSSKESPGVSGAKYYFSVLQIIYKLARCTLWVWSFALLPHADRIVLCEATSKYAEACDSSTGWQLSPSSSGPEGRAYQPLTTLPSYWCCNSHSVELVRVVQLASLVGKKYSINKRVNVSADIN